MKGIRMTYSGAFAFGFFCLCVAAGGLFAVEDLDIGGAVLYDYDPKTQPGDAVFGTIVANMQQDHPGRNAHGGPVCLQYANGNLAVFYTNTSGHNIDGWSEYALSTDGGKTWAKYNPVKHSYDAYRKNPKEPVWVEEGLVTGDGTAILFLTRLKGGKRLENGLLRSSDHGASWTEYETFTPPVVGYPCATAVSGDTAYVLFDSNEGPHVLYASTDQGRTWQRRSVLPLDDDKWYGAMCLMADGRLLAGAYTEKNEKAFYYCISADGGQTWGEQKTAIVPKGIRDPELACLEGQYFLHGRSGNKGEGANRFVLYTSRDGENWNEGILVSRDPRGPDGYSHNCIVRKNGKPDATQLMINYSIIYSGRNTNQYVFFVKPKHEE